VALSNGLRDLQVSISETERSLSQGPSHADAGINVVFHIPGHFLGNDFEGVRTGSLLKALRTQVVQVAVPDGLDDPGDVTDFLARSFAEALRMASERLVNKRPDLSNERAMAIAQQAIDRFRQRQASSGKGQSRVRQRPTTTFGTMTASEAMGEALFWDLVAMLDWTFEGDDEEVVEPLVQALTAMPMGEIADFQERLAQALHSLDGRAWARESGESVWWGEPDRLSEDGFLYARCAVVANGREFYEAVLQDPKQMPKEIEYESLLYVAPRAYGRQPGSEDDELPGTLVSFETFSNRDGWTTRERG
jgi:hypothetical protein